MICPWREQISISHMRKSGKAGKSAACVGQRTFSCPAGVRGSQMCSERSAPPKATSCEPAGATATQYTALDPSWRSVHVHISASHLLTCPMHTLISQRPGSHGAHTKRAWMTSKWLGIS